MIQEWVAMVFKFKLGRLMIISQLVCLMAVLNGCSSGSSSTGASAAAPDAIVGSGSSGPATTTSSPPGPSATQASATPETAIATAATVTATNSGDACLPITMPTRDVLFGSSKKVFAHYFYPYPLSIDNRSPKKDYYNTQFLNKEGESNKWSAQGGLLRQRPLPVNASSDPHWRQINMQHEVTTAIARGITGFAFDVMSVDQATNASSQLHLMLAAAQAVDSRFKIMVMPDITALGTDFDGVRADHPVRGKKSRRIQTRRWATCCIRLRRESQLPCLVADCAESPQICRHQCGIRADVSRLDPIC